MATKEYAGADDDLAREPQNYTRLQGAHGGRVLAFGRDPYFAEWPETLQLNHANPATQQAMTAALVKIAGQCDGVRCGMAMRVLPDVFERTWGLRAAPFWPRATARVREQAPGFCFMSEVYLDLEWTLQQQGFNYTYDKRLFVTLPFGDPAGAEWRLTDQIEDTVYDRDGGDLQTRGLYVDATPWQASVFTLTRRSAGA